jgi:hypothetical protein
MPEISASEYLNSLLVAYQNAEKHYSQAVADLVSAEIRRDESKTVKDEAFDRLEEAREKYSSPNAQKGGGGKIPRERSFNKKHPGKANSFQKKGPGKANSFQKKGPGKANSFNKTHNASHATKKGGSAPPPAPAPTPVRSPVPGSKKAPKIFSKRDLRRSIPVVKLTFEPLESETNVLEICKGRSREWFDDHLDCESLGLVKKFYQASFGTKTHEKTQKVSVFTIVLNEDWNDLVTKTSELQEMYIGKNTDPNGKATMRDRAAEALVAPPQKEPIALFFAPKNSKGTSDIYYGGHWRVVDGKLLRPPRSVKGQLRQCLAKFEFVGVDKAIVEAINRD